MRSGRERGRLKAAGLVVTLVATTLAGTWVAEGQNPAPAPGGDPAAVPTPGKDKDTKGKSKRAPLRLRAPAREPTKGTRKAAVDPLADPAANGNANPGGVNPGPNPVLDPSGPLPELGTYHYRYKVSAGNSDSLSAAYYPSKLANAAPAVILIHERDHSIKDFEESLADLRGSTLAESLQQGGYAVLAIDLHGHGGNTRRNLTPRDWLATPGDVELAYLALLDRHNRGELNLAKLGLIGLGEGANVAAAWAAGGGGVSSEGHAGDLGAFVVISPMADAASQGLHAAPNLTTLAARVPLSLMVGERDLPSFELVDAIKPIIKRYPKNQVETFPSALHAYQLLRLEPNLTGSMLKFLDATIKAKADEWEGRYLLDPIHYTEIKVIPNPVRPGDAAAKKAAPR